ncbi:hypothetical protein ABZY32_19015, partial [Nocardiopsis alba]|uniref:hypothetical protein n=1 Tax=Nocardiopsis alba TaxID=53437 RepID=UPI0033AE959B
RSPRAHRATHHSQSVIMAGSESSRRAFEMSSKDGFLATVMASMEAKEERISIQEFGLLLGGEIGLINEFEAPLELPEMQPLELSITLRGDEEGSAFPIYVT